MSMSRWLMALRLRQFTVADGLVKPQDFRSLQTSEVSFHGMVAPADGRQAATLLRRGFDLDRRIVGDSLRGFALDAPRFTFYLLL